MNAKSSFHRLVLLGVALCVAVSIGAAGAVADSYSQFNLVSDIPGLAPTTDPSLVNPWGMSFSATSPFWISDQGTGIAQLISGAGAVNPTLAPTIPSIPGGPNGPTGQVFANISGNFVLPNGSASTFIFATLAGSLAGWNGGAGNSAVQVAATPGAVYTGLALGNNGTSNLLYAANFTPGGGINVFDSSFHATTVIGSFVDPNLPAGYAPYNVENIGGNLYVTYAQPGSHGAITGAGLGVVDEFNLNGVLIGRVITGGPLNAPWGIALAGANFGPFSNDLLVGNFGNGEIDAFNPLNGTFLGTLDDASGNPIVNSGLWAIEMGNAGTGSNPNALYFNAGLNGETAGLFGDIAFTPEPGTITLLASGFIGLLGLRRRKS